MLFKKYVRLCEVQIPHSAQTACSLVIHVDGGMEPSNTLLAFSVSKFRLFRSVVCVAVCRHKK